MSDFYMFNNTSELDFENLFSIPEDAKFPIFDDCEAKLLLSKEGSSQKDQSQKGLFMGEILPPESLDLNADKFMPYEEPQEFELRCDSPKFEQKDFKATVHPNLQITNETSNISFEHTAKINRETKGKENDLDSYNELTNEITHDNEYKIATEPSCAPKSRFRTATKFSATPQISPGGGQTLHESRRRSSRPKMVKKSSESTDEVSPCHKGISLAKRKDVVNKTLLRSVKRYYTSLFEQYVKDNQYSKQEKREYWKEYIFDFTKATFGDYMDVISQHPNATIQEVNAFMASMIMPNSIKRAECESVYNTMMEDFSNLLYKYSIKRLGVFMKNASVGYVLRHYIEQGPLQDLLENDVTLSKNKQLYQKASKDILGLTV